MTRSIAAFDFDGTITDRDTLVAFVRRVSGRRRFLRAVTRTGVDLAGRRPTSGARDAAKAVFLRHALRGLPHEWLLDEGARYADQLIAHRVRPAMRRLIDWHVANGHDVLIVSAGLDVYLSHVAGALGASAVLCSTLAVDANGLATGDLEGANCRGIEKVNRIHEYTSGRISALWAYGNSSGDDAMLARADYAYRVNRGGRLVPAR